MGAERDGVKTSRHDVSYIHIRVEPNPEVHLSLRDLMGEATHHVRRRLGSSARVTGVASMHPAFNLLGGVPMPPLEESKSPPTPTRLSFSYINHRGDLHSYLVEPIAMEFGPCQCFPEDPDRPVWHIRANVIERDHEPRPGERSFALVKMSHEIQEVS